MPYLAGSQNLNFETVTQAMKIHYKPLRVKEMVYKNNPLLALLPKYESFDGLNMPIPILYGNPQRAGAIFKSAQSIKSTSSLEQFVITRKKDYSFASIDAQTIKASASNAGAFLRYLTMEIDGAIHTIKRRLAFDIYGDGGGSIGSWGSAASTVTTLADASQITNFEVGMWLEGWRADGTTKLTCASSGTKPADVFAVTAVDRDAGTFTTDIAVGGTPATGSLFYPYGNIVTNPATDGAVKCDGLGAWVPSNRAVGGSDPLKVAFNGVDRSVDPTRLGGIYYDGTAMPIEEALISAAGRVAREGGNPDLCMVDYSTWVSLEKALGSKVVYTTATARDVDIGFHGMAIQGPNGVLKVIPDQNCQANTAWLLQMDTWSMNSLGQVPAILDLDSNRMLRESTADAYEVRIGYYANMACNAPGWNCRVSL